jgi:hypothetical protein
MVIAGHWRLQLAAGTRPPLPTRAGMEDNPMGDERLTKLPSVLGWVTTGAIFAVTGGLVVSWLLA